MNDVVCRMSFPQRLGLSQFIDNDSEKTQLAAKGGAGDCMTCDTLPAASDCQTQSPVDGEEGNKIDVNAVLFSSNGKCLCSK
jgi:hypothetical protein